MEVDHDTEDIFRFCQIFIMIQSQVMDVFNFFTCGIFLSHDIIDHVL